MSISDVEFEVAESVSELSSYKKKLGEPRIPRFSSQRYIKEHRVPQGPGSNQHHHQHIHQSRHWHG